MVVILAGDRFDLIRSDSIFDSDNYYSLLSVISLDVEWTMAKMPKHQQQHTVTNME